MNFALPLVQVVVGRLRKRRAEKKEQEKFNGFYDGDQQASSSAPRQKHFQPLAIVPLVITSIALILSLLCIFAGHTTSMMQDYAVLTLNTSRFGQNVVNRLDQKIDSFNLSDIGLKKRADLVILPATPTAAPITLVTMAPIARRGDIESLYSKATKGVASDVSSLKSKGKSEFNEASSLVHSKITSAEGAVKSEVASVIQEVEDGIIKLINDAYTSFIDEMDIQDFYNVHVMASCRGTYVFQNGTNVTVGESGYPTPSGTNGVHSHVDTCEEHSAIDPLQLIRVIYWVSVVHTIASFLSGAWALFRGCSTKVLSVNLVLTLFASITIALASLLVHGLGLAATKVINFLGSDLGLTAYQGQKFLAMTWTTTALLVLNLIVWIVIFYVQKHRAGDTTAHSKPRSSTEKDAHAMDGVARPPPVHSTGGYL